MQRQERKTSMIDGKRLTKWAVEELQVPGLSADADLSYVCRGEMCVVWQYLVDNITNRETAKLVRDNLQLQRQKTSVACTDADAASRARYDEKMKRYNLLAQKINKQKLELSHLEDSIKLDQSELSAQSIALQKSKAGQREDANKIQLLTQHRDVLLKHKEVLERFQNRLQSVIDKYDVTQQKDFGTLHSSLDSSGRNATVVQLRKLQQSVADFLLMLLQGTVSKTSLQQRKTEIKASLSELMSTAGCAKILSYIVHDITRTTETIKHDTAAIDYAADVQKLRFRVVDEGLVDESTEPSLLNGLTEIIEQMQLEHQERFMDTERCRAESVILKKQIEKLKERVHSRILSKVGRSNNYAIIREIIDKEVSERQVQASLTVVHSIKAGLQQQVENSSKRLATLREKHAAIANFRSDVQKKQNQICVLLKQNVDSHGKLCSRQGLIQSTVESLRSNAEPLELLSSDTVTTNYSYESNKLYSISLDALSAHPNSALRGLHEAEGKASEDLQRLMQHLDFRHFLANDALLKTILEKKLQILDSYTTVPVLSSPDDEKLAEEINGKMLPQAKQQVDRMLRELVPKLQGSKDTINKAHARCDKVHSLIDEWWKQPALNLDLGR